MNLALAPRQKNCTICAEITAVEDVTWRLLTEDGETIKGGTREAAKYVRSVGMGGTPQAVFNRLNTHRKHVLSWFRRQRLHVVATDGVVVPMQVDGGVSRIPAETGPARWLDVTQSAMDLGSQALVEALARLQGGEMEDKDVIALAKLGVGTATTRANIELKGRKQSGLDELLELASGLRRE